MKYPQYIIVEKYLATGKYEYYIKDNRGRYLYYKSGQGYVFWGALRAWYDRLVNGSFPSLVSKKQIYYSKESAERECKRLWQEHLSQYTIMESEHFYDPEDDSQELTSSDGYGRLRGRFESIGTIRGVTAEELSKWKIKH